MIKIFLNVLSLRVFSRIYGWLVRRRHPRFIIRRIIRLFHDTYGIEMDEYMGEIDDYKSLCDFFIRPLDPQKRPLVPVKDFMVSPSDGKLSKVETIFEERTTQVKGKTYSVQELIGEKVDFSKGWTVATIYLAPSNYHRYHYPVGGKIEGYLHTGGRLYPVNHLGLNNIPELFIRNERIITRMKVETGKGEFPLYIVAVGATFVGTVIMEYIEGKHKHDEWIGFEKEVNQLDEMGRFEMGSTLVLVFPKDMGSVIEGVVEKPVRVGDRIFDLSL